MAITVWHPRCSGWLEPAVVSAAPVKEVSMDEQEHSKGALLFMLLYLLTLTALWLNAYLRLWRG